VHGETLVKTFLAFYWSAIEQYKGKYGTVDAVKLLIVSSDGMIFIYIDAILMYCIGYSDIEIFNSSLYIQVSQ